MPKNIKNTNEENFVTKFKSSESAVSMILGVIVVVVVGVLLFRYFRQTKLGMSLTPGIQKGESTTSPSPETKEESATTISLPAKYAVQKGDNLWKISTKFYGYGFNWVDISQENKLKDPDQLEVGKELIIPNVAVRKPITTSSKDAQTISANSYKVVKGDTLWKISVRAYQDGYKWPEIAKASHLINPDLIHAGNVLTIPR